MFLCIFSSILLGRMAFAMCFVCAISLQLTFVNEICQGTPGRDSLLSWPPVVSNKSVPFFFHAPLSSAFPSPVDTTFSPMLPSPEIPNHGLDFGTMARNTKNSL